MGIEPVKYDFDEACLEPKTLCSFLGIKGNYLGHEVAITIGHPKEPPKKRGQSAGYSLKNGVLITFGRPLISMGITPQRVRVCVDAVLNKWNLIEPDILDLDNEMAQRAGSNHFLLASEQRSGFEAELVPQEQALARIGALPAYSKETRPQIIQNMTAFALTVSFGLLNHMRKSGKDLPIKKRGKKLPVKE